MDKSWPGVSYSSKVARDVISVLAFAGEYTTFPALTPADINSERERERERRNLVRSPGN